MTGKVTEQWCVLINDAITNTNVSDRRMNEWMNEWMDGWMDGWMNELMN
jgi:hypothetical protein